MSAIKQHQSRKYIKCILTERNDIFLELGAGAKKGKNGWLTIDITSGCDIYYDMRNGLPFPDNSVAKIYSSHFFEHLQYNAILAFLDECRRVLVSGGTFSICVPNAKLYIEAYLNSASMDEELFLSYKPAYSNYGGIDLVNYIAYMDGQHNYMFDEVNLLNILKIKNFTNVRLRSYDPDLDLITRDHLSIYAEAEK